MSNSEKENIPETPAFKQGHNCWQYARADKAALLIDCANYYRALYHALCLAKHSIFILGWDIDSRIELLRGAEAKGKEIPVALFDLICCKARENPDLKIYLNKWNYSVFFSKEREPFAGLKWHLHSPDNVHFCSDYKIPITGCHHQKIIVVDDEIAFCGGMDIALGRWDKRAHHVEVEDRVDPPGFLNRFKPKPYGPYHDIMIMTCGQVVRILSQIVRERWQKGSGYDSVPVRTDVETECRLWPDFKKPDFEGASVAVARTMPRTREKSTTTEILYAYLDEINKAEKFIYIENQYLTSLPIARAINRRLKEKPELRVIAVSSDHPRGIMEHKAMWTGRVKFCDTASEGINNGRFMVTYPTSREDGIKKTVHIHSKLMIVDNRSLHVGSSNLNNRSMGFDTECDMTVIPNTPQAADRIAAIRTNLLREHTGREEHDIERIINENGTLEELIEYQPESRQHLVPIDNEPYRDEIFAETAIKIGDPVRAKFLANMPVRQVLGSIFILTLLGLLFWTWLEPAFGEFFSKETITGSIEKARDSRWGLLWMAGIYIVAGFMFFPVTVLNLTTAIVFGPLQGLIYGLFGSLCSAAVLYLIGRLIGRKTFAMFRNTMEKVRTYAEHGGVMGMTLIRLMPIAPFTLVNIAFGITRVSFPSYILATVLGLAPGIVAKAMFGGAIGELWEDPDPKVISFAVGSLLLWFLIIWGSHRIVRHYKTELQL